MRKIHRTVGGKGIVKTTGVLENNIHDIMSGVDVSLAAQHVLPMVVLSSRLAKLPLLNLHLLFRSKTVE